MPTNADDPATEPTTVPSAGPDSDAADTISLADTISPDDTAQSDRGAPAPTLSRPVFTATLPVSASAPAGRPPVRWAGIVWGILLITFATVTLIVVSSPVRLAGVTVWIASLTPGAAWALWVALLGLVIVVSALLGAISAAQRNRRRRSL